MLDLPRVLRSAKSHPRGELAPMSTPWGEALDPAHVLPEHPRPLLERKRWGSLNGTWEYAIAPAPLPEGIRALTRAQALEAVAAARLPEAWNGEILVPFSPEAPLSGVGHVLMPDELLWYRRTVELPPLAPGERLLLHLEAVDWACACMVDGRLAGTHVGGYLPFDLDVTELVRPGGAADTAPGTFELALCVYDPTDAGTQPRGKQRLDARGIWYTPQSGIWQSVWWEVVPAAHLRSLSLEGAADGTLEVRAEVALPEDTAGGGATEPGTPAATLELVLLAEGAEAERFELPVRGADVRATLALEDPHLWSPDDPFLYDVTATLRAGGAAPDGPAPDRVRSSCAFRTACVASDADGTPRFFLNGRPLFLKGVLDQGYWPDGLMTAPSDEALVHDIAEMRAAGFNLLRKHLKVESARWYWHCDRMGMLVWQDAVSGGSPYSPWHTSQKPTLFRASWGRLADDTPRGQKALSSADADYQDEWTETCLSMVRRLRAHPCVITWALFNEGWGQFDARRAEKLVRAEDPTRPVDAVSGWYDQGAGDFCSVHNYFRPLAVWPDRVAARRAAPDEKPRRRAFVISEFGGLTQPVEGHTAVAQTYGYGSLPTASAWRAAVRDLLAQADALEAEGLAGYVYTQVSDVEGEVNGLLTYDRRVSKLREA